MKIAIVAAAILSSSAAMAFTPTIPRPAELLFKAEQLASCSIVVDKAEAPLVFNYSEVSNPDNLAKVQFSADFADKVHVYLATDMVDTAAWGGKTPDMITYVDFGGEKFNQAGNQGFNKTYNLNGQAGQQVDYTVGILAQAMTHKGTGEIKSTVQFECE